MAILICRRWIFDKGDDNSDKPWFFSIFRDDELAKSLRSNTTGLEIGQSNRERNFGLG
jgi:hypothetical protein